MLCRNELQSSTDELEALTKESGAARADSAAAVERLREEAATKHSLMEQALAVKESEKEALEARHDTIIVQARPSVAYQFFCTFVVVPLLGKRLYFLVWC